MERETNRVAPVLPASAMRTHQVATPLRTHFRKATCEEVGCLAYRHGWALNLTGLDEGDIWQARNSGRRYREEAGETGMVLIFEPGQPCFAASTHRVPADRPPIFLARDGDWRGNPRGTEPVIFSGADAFTNDLHDHLEKFDK